jgi:hypothetical protein
VSSQVATDRRALQRVSTSSLVTLFLLPMITICWILVADPGLFGF